MFVSAEGRAAQVRTDYRLHQTHGKGEPGGRGGSEHPACKAETPSDRRVEVAINTIATSWYNLLVTISDMMRKHVREGEQRKGKLTAFLFTHA